MEINKDKKLECVELRVRSRGCLDVCKVLQSVGMYLIRGIKEGR